MSDKVFIFDTTLRDGEQSPGISLGVREKLEIARQLARMGVDAVEAGFPITSLGDFEAVSAIAEKVKGISVVGLCRAVAKDIDRAWEAVKKSERPRIHTFAATSDVHINRKYGKTRDEVLKMIEDAVKRAKQYTDDVEFSPEDATRSDKEFLRKALEVALENGATVLNIPDTVGYALPDEFGKLISYLKQNVQGIDNAVISVHCHNDLGLSVANSLAALESGARQVECTINGLGERAGNAALEEIVMIMETRRQSLDLTTNIKTEEITKTSRLVANLTGYPVQFNKAIVGANAFAHSSGIHTDGMLKDRTTYEIMDPKQVGISESKFILGKTSGRHVLKKHLEMLDIHLSEEDLDQAFVRFKALADKKQEITDLDLEALVAEEARAYEDIYKLEAWHIASGTGETPDGSVKLSKAGQGIIEESAEGDGPVDAVCNAISKATGVETKLLSYNVSAITGGLDAQGDVSIRLEIFGMPALGRGVSTDIVEASAKAYLNAINRALAPKR